MAHVIITISVNIEDEKLLLKRGDAIEKWLGGEGLKEVVEGDHEAMLCLAARNVVLWNRPRPYFDHAGIDLDTLDWEYYGPPNYEVEDE